MSSVKAPKLASLRNFQKTEIVDYIKSNLATTVFHLLNFSEVVANITLARSQLLVVLRFI